MNTPTAADTPDERFLLAYVSKDSRVIGIEHETEADWNDVYRAHVALRDRLNERIAEKDKCPYGTPVAADTGGLVERAVAEAEDDGARMLKAERDAHIETSRQAVALAFDLRASEQQLAAAREQIAELERKNTEVGQEAFTLRNSLRSAESSSANWHRLHDKQDEAREAAEASLSSAHETIRAEQTTIANYLRDVASHYTLHSDGSNTFVMAAEWVEARAALTLAAKEMPDGQ